MGPPWGLRSGERLRMRHLQHCRHVGHGLHWRRHLRAHGGGATNATLALLGGGTLAAGGAGVAGGTLLLTGIVAAPVAALAAGGLFLVARRRSQQEEERLSRQLDQAEAALEATQAGFDALAEALPRATELLDYVGVHSAHALEKWKQRLGPMPVDWSGLSEGQQQAYRDFITVAACELSVDSIDARRFMTAEDDAFEHFVREVDDTLTHADRTVRSLT